VVEEEGTENMIVKRPARIGRDKVRRHTTRRESRPHPIPTKPPAEVQEPIPTQPFEPPAGFKEYQAAAVGISVYIPESWVITGIIDGQYAIL